MTMLRDCLACGSPGLPVCTVLPPHSASYPSSPTLCHHLSTDPQSGRQCSDLDARPSRRRGLKSAAIFKRGCERHAAGRLFNQSSAPVAPAVQGIPARDGPPEKLADVYVHVACPEELTRGLPAPLAGSKRVRCARWLS
ncbi:hypothetical protein PHLGIDRAFT_253570 [Phlebiopsis gigantea 11061_1 CR5-6]|uniref:Uncharacterized protein n=1 Tax=Phlebiopsis gigantea (strain 11061_1 CR5-6) TaxID=745531 RepID=A0A0C3NET8_PHLG1|nr:hypothetical protein PHLGIDRAFT_253570 [Phlebiopsis gigantea 11061_1 CR5-6]